MGEAQFTLAGPIRPAALFGSWTVACMRPDRGGSSFSV